MCNRPPVHVPGNCPPIEVDIDEFRANPFKWLRQANNETAVHVMRDGVLSMSVGGSLSVPDPRDTELTALRAQLADAKAVIEAAEAVFNDDGHGREEWIPFHRALCKYRGEPYPYDEDDE